MPVATAPAPALPLRERVQAELARRSLREFIRQAWHIVEPGVPYVGGWHIDAISDHLEACSRREIRQLLINIPPRTSKSLSVAVFWPCWEWITHPEVRWMFASYAQELSTRDSVKCRRIIESDWYRDRWGDRYQLVGDQNMKTKFENDRTGVRMATSVGGSATGEGGDRIVLDDPHKADEAESDAVRLSVLDWWDGTMSTRGNDPRTVVKVIVMQRLHQQDLSGHVLERGGWDQLCLPMEYEGNRIHTVLGWTDPRTEPGELLWPERFNAASVTQLTRDLGSYRSAGQLQQRPAPAEGGKLHREWFSIVDDWPREARRVRYWDMAATEPKPGRSPDYTAGCLMAELAGRFWLVDMRRAQLSPLGVENLVRQTAETDGIAVKVYIEEEGGASGKIASDRYAREVLKGFAFSPDRPTGSKEVRSNPLSAAAEAGNVLLVRGGWNVDFLDEIEVFPYGKHDDQVDAASGAFGFLARPVRGGRVTVL